MFIMTLPFFVLLGNIDVAKESEQYRNSSLCDFSAILYFICLNKGPYPLAIDNHADTFFDTLPVGIGQ